MGLSGKGTTSLSFLHNPQQWVGIGDRQKVMTILEICQAMARGQGGDRGHSLARSSRAGPTGVRMLRLVFCRHQWW